MLFLSEPIQHVCERDPLVLVRPQGVLYGLSSDRPGEGMLAVLGAQGLPDAGQDLLRDVLAVDSRRVAFHLRPPQAPKQPFQTCEVDRNNPVHWVSPSAIIEGEGLAGRDGKVG